MSDTNLLMMMPQCRKCGEYHSLAFDCQSQRCGASAEAVTLKPAPIRDLATLTAEFDKMRRDLDKLIALFETQQVGK